MSVPPQGPQQPQFPSPDQSWSSQPPPTPQPQWAQTPPPQPPKNRLTWVLAGVVGLLVIAVIVVFALDVARPDDQPTDGGGTTQATPSDDETEGDPTTDPTAEPTTDQPTDQPTGELIGLSTNAAFDPSSVTMEFDPPDGFTLADDTPDYPRWDHHDQCYVGLARFELEPGGADTDAMATSWSAVDIVEYYQSERYDTSVITAEGTATVAIEGGGELEMHVVELEFRREEDGPLLWAAFVMRHMTDVGVGISLNYSCEAGQQPVTLDEVLEATGVRL